jgi:iron(III) transport system permease protein
MPTTFPDSTRVALSESARKQRALRGVLNGAVGIVAALALIPFVYLLIRASQKPVGEIAQLLIRPKTLEVLAITSALVLCVVVTTVVMGVLMASGLHFVRLPFRGLLLIPTVLPLAIPSYVFTYTWVALIPGFSGFFAAAFILSITTLPYVILATLSGLRTVDSSQIEVARSLGLTLPQIFRRVVFPQVKGHISAGALLAALYTISDFGAVSLLNVETLTVTIQNMYRASYDRSAAAVISFVLIAFSTIVVLADERIKRQTPDSNVVKAYSTKSTLISSTWLRITMIATVALYALNAVLIPFYVLISRFLGNQVAIDWADLLTASISTISVAAFGALIALVLSAPIGVILSGSSTRVGLTAQRIITIGHGLPGVVVGLAIVSIGSKLGALYQTTFLLAFAYALLFLAKSVASMNSSLSRVPTSVKDVASTLGMNQWHVIKKVVAPIAAPGIGLGTILVFLTAMKELPATLMLRPTGFETLATQIWSAASINRFNEAAPYALILVLIAALPTFLISRPDKADRAFIHEPINGIDRVGGEK